MQAIVLLVQELFSWQNLSDNSSTYGRAFSRHHFDVTKRKLKFLKGLISNETKASEGFFVCILKNDDVK